MIHLTASHFAFQPLALPGVRYRLHARICALHNRHLLGRRVDITRRRGGHTYRLTGVLVADVCGTTGRIDLPTGTFAELAGKGWRKAGLCPVVVKIGPAWRGEWHKHPKKRRAHR